MGIHDEFAAVTPVHPPAPYIGGKRKLAARLVQQIGAVPHRTYAEVFVGMGGVFFRRQKHGHAAMAIDRPTRV